MRFQNKLLYSTVILVITALKSKFEKVLTVSKKLNIQAKIQGVRVQQYARRVNDIISNTAICYT